MLFHLFAFSMTAAFISFISGYLCEISAMNNLAELFFLGGIILMVVAYGAVVLAFLSNTAISVIDNAKLYFSTPETLKRRILSSQIRQMHLKQRHRFEKQQIHYRNEHLRKRLYHLNNKKHMRQLSKSITRDLNSTRNEIPGPTCKLFKNSLHKNYRMKNVDVLIKLNLEITANR